MADHDWVISAEMALSIFIRLKQAKMKKQNTIKLIKEIIYDLQPIGVLYIIYLLNS